MDCSKDLKTKARNKLAAMCANYLEQTPVKLLLSETSKGTLLAEYPLAGRDLRDFVSKHIARF